MFPVDKRKIEKSKLAIAAFATEERGIEGVSLGTDQPASRQETSGAQHSASSFAE